MCTSWVEQTHWYGFKYIEINKYQVYKYLHMNAFQGVYQCIARNCMGNAQSSTELTLEDIQHQLSDDEKRQLLQDKTSRPPKFLKGLKSIEQKIGESCQLQVQVNDPKATVSWFRDGIHQIERWITNFWEFYSEI